MKAPDPASTPQTPDPGDVSDPAKQAGPQSLRYPWIEPRMKRFRVTRIAAYFYHSRFTLSFSWRCIWHWLPSFDRPDCNGGWGIIWGWFWLEKLKFDPYDDWGQERAEIQLGILNWLAEDIGLENTEAEQ